MEKQYLSDSDVGFGSNQASGGQSKAAPKYLSDSDVGFAPTKRTWGEAAKDTGAAVMGGLAGLAKTGGDLYGLATGDMGNALSRAGGNAQEYWDDAKSDTLKAKVAQRKERIDAQDTTVGKAWTAVKETLTDPALAADMAASNVATVLPGMAAGRLAKGAVAARGLAAAQEAGPVAQAAQQAIAKQAATLGTRTSIGTGAVQQGADVSGDIYADVLKKPDEAWDANPDFAAAVQRHGGDREAAKRELATQTARASLAPATAVSLAANLIPGASYLERALVGGAARETAKEGARFALPKAIAKGALGEGAQEALEEGGGRLAANVAAQQYVDPGHDTWDQVGENAGMGAAGGILMGGAGGVFHGGQGSHVNAPASDPRSSVEGAANPQGPSVEPVPQAAPGQAASMQGETLYADERGNVGASPEAVQANQATQPQAQDEQPVNSEPAPAAQAKAARDAEMAASRAVQSQDEGILQSTGAAALRPSEAMGLRSGPEAGTLENAAALSVDTGATAQLQQAAAQAQAAEQAAKAKPASQKQEQPAQKRQALGPEMGEAPGANSLAERSDSELSAAFRAAQAPEVRRQLADAPAAVAAETGDVDRAAELQSRLDFVRQQAAASGWDQRLVAERDRVQAELQALPTAAQPAPSAVSAPTSVQEGIAQARARRAAPADVSQNTQQSNTSAQRVAASDATAATAPLSQPQGVNRESQAAQAQPIQAQQPQAGGAAPVGRAAAAVDASPPPAGGSGLQAAGLSSAAPTQNPGAQAAPAAGAQAAAQDSEVEALRQKLRDVEAKILAAAPGSMGQGGGDIEAAMKSRKVPVTLKAQRKKLKEQLQQSQDLQQNQPPAQSQQAQAATEQQAAPGRQSTESAYTLPSGSIGDEWRDGQKRSPKHPDFTPTPRQQLLMDAVAKALDDGAFYKNDVTDKVAKALGVSGEVLASNRTGVQGGDFGYDVYNARNAVEAQRGNAKSREFAKSMNLKPGDALGTLVFQDGKVTTGVKVVSINESGLIVTITGKRGSATLDGEVGVDNLAAALDRAHEKGKRKDSYEEFIAGRSANLQEGIAAAQDKAQQAEAAQQPTTQQADNDFLPEGWTKSVNGYTKRPVYRMEQGVGQPSAVVTQTEGMTYEVQIRHGDKQLTVSNQTGALSEVLAKAETELIRMTQADSVTHQDPGEKAEAATPAVVTDSLKKAARNEDTKPSEMRKWLVAEIDKELLQAADRPDYDEAVKRMGEKDAISGYTGNGPFGKNNETGYITFDVPGDGKYKVRNSVRGLLEFRKNVMASQGFKDTKTRAPVLTNGPMASMGVSDAIKNMLAEGDVQAAVDYARAKGIEFQPTPPKLAIDANGSSRSFPASVESVPAGAVKLTEKERDQLATWLSANGGQEPSQSQPAANKAKPQPAAVTRADVQAAKLKAVEAIAARIDAMTAGEVNRIAKKFLPTMGLKPTVGKERNKAMFTDASKMNLEAAAAELGVDLPADVLRALDADRQGLAQDGANPSVLRPADAQDGAKRGVVGVAQADQIARSILGRAGLSEKTIATVESFSALPKDMQEEAKAQGKEGQIKGALHGSSGVIYLVADQHTSAADVKETVLHELMGHKGVRALFGRDYVSAMNRLFAAMGGWDGVKRIAKGRGMLEQLQGYRETLFGEGRPDWSQDMRIAVLTDELMAAIAQKPTLLDRAKEVIGAIRQWLRDHGFAELAAYGEADLLRVLQQGRQVMRERAAAPAGKTVFLGKAKEVTPEQRAQNFSRWSSDAPLVSSDQAEQHDFKTGQKIVVEAFHGTARPDRIGAVFDPKRATSGPMAFFTSSPELASSYSTGKADTSLSDEDQQYANWFKFKPQGARSSVPIDRAWALLTPEQRERVRELAPQVRLDDDSEGVVLDSDAKDGLGNYQWELQQTRTSWDRGGNPLKALAESWLTSGSLFGDERKFLDVLRLAGFPVKDVTADFPTDSFPGVFKTFISMKSPLVVSDMPAEVRDALERAAKSDRSRAKPGADMWDKRSHTLRDWWAKFSDPDPSVATYAWTSIPDKVTDILKSYGFDGIVDWSGKGGGHQAPVYIPFAPNQVKSFFNRGTFDPTKKDITHFGATKDGTEAMSPAVANAMRALSQPRPVDSAVLGMVREGRQARDILSLVAGTSKSRFNRQVARLLLKTGANPTTHLDNASMGGEHGFKFLAKYSRAANAITMSDGAMRQGEQIFLHEMIHAATLKALDRKGLQSLQMRRLYEHVKKQGGADLLSQYGMKNVGEFVAEAFTNPQFQRALRQMDAPSGGGLKSGWDGFVRILRSILGLPQDGHDALSQALEIGVNVMREDKALRERGVRAGPVGDAYAQSSSTRANFESRIDALFNGGKATTGTRVLDRSDVMALLGYPDVPLMLNERHLLDGLTNHPEMTATAWKKVPGWLENPSMVYRDPRDSGRLVVIAPDALAGYPVMLVVEPKPNPAGSRPAPAVPTESLLVTVYAKTSGNLPAPGFLASSGNLLYVDTKNAPEVARRGGVQFPKQAALLQGRQKILTEKNLAGWRKTNAGESDDAYFGAADPSAPSAMQTTRAKLGERLNDAFSAPGTLSKWHTTVGTMYNLAEQQPAFKPVFESAKAYVDDISQYAMDAADQAPTIIPRLEDMKDAIPFASKKKPVSAADNKAIAAPIFEGTLNWARDLSGKPVPLESLEKEAATMTAEQKAQRLLRAGAIDAGLLKGWQGMPLESYEKAVNTRYESRILKPGVTWTDAELKSQWGLNDHQVALYREYRAAVDRSIDTTTRADILRFGGKQLEPLRAMVMDAANMDDALQLITSMARAEMASNPDSAQAWGDVMQGAVERVDRAHELQKRGYAPLQRFGEYTVDVVVDGERKFFSLYETKAEANAAAKAMREEYGDANVAQGTLSKEEHKMLAGVTPESLELFGNMLGLASDGDAAQDKVFQEFLRRTKSNNSALKRLIHRKGTAGFSEDVGRGLASFIYSNARMTSGGLNVGRLTEAVAAIPKNQGQLHDAAERLRQHVLEPQEAGASVRGFMFAQYLGGSAASALVNLTQPMATTLPYLSQFGGATKAASALLKASKDMATPGLQYEKDLAEALKRAEDNGTVSPQEIHYLMGQARGQAVLRAGGDTKLSVAQAMAANGWARTKLGWGLMFGAAEQVNRRMTFIAAYRLAKSQGMANPSEFAAKAVDETQFVQNKANKMEWGRSTAGGTLMTFKGYSIAYLELMHRMWTQGGPEGKRGVLLAAATLMLLGGAGGLPFMEDAEDIATALGRMLGYNWSAKKARQELLEEVFGRQFAQFADKGLSGLPGAPIDVSGRLGMGNLIPGTGLLLDKTNNSRDYMELLGPAGDFVSRVIDGGKQVLGGVVSGDTGKVARGALNVAPAAVRNMAKGVEMASSGQYKDMRGNKVMDVTPAEAAAKFIGFQPNSVADAQEANAMRQDAKNFYALKRSQITAMWAGGVADRDADKVQQARDAIADWNRKNPDQPMLVRIPDVMRRVKEMNKTKEQRILDSAPKAMKNLIREDIARAAMPS